MHTEVLVGGGRCTTTTFPQSSLKGGFYSVTKKSKETTVSVYRTVPHSKSFVHQPPQDRNRSQPQHNNFKYHSLPAMEPLCATVNGDKEMWFAPQDASWLVTEQYWFTLMLLVRPSWDTTKAYSLCEVPLRKIYYLGFALFSLQALTADPPGQEFCMQAQCSMGAPIYLSDAERTDIQANLFSLHWYCKALSALHRFSVGKPAAACSVPWQHWYLLQPPHWTMSLTIL